MKNRAASMLKTADALQIVTPPHPLTYHHSTPDAS
jgi:hypothetical protein